MAHDINRTRACFRRSVFDIRYKGECWGCKTTPQSLALDAQGGESRHTNTARNKIKAKAYSSRS